MIMNRRMWGSAACSAVIAVLDDLSAGTAGAEEAGGAVSVRRMDGSGRRGQWLLMGKKEEKAHDHQKS